MSIPEIGKPLDRVDGRAKVTGGAKYAAEHNLPGTVHAVLVMATIPAGRIRSIDDSAAKASPGVIAVLSHLNAPKMNPPKTPSGPSSSETGRGGAGANREAGSGGGGQSGSQQSGGHSAGQSGGGGQQNNLAEPHYVPFSDGTIHYLGQRIAVVVADTLEHATRGAELVKVAYEPAPARIDMEQFRGEAYDRAKSAFSKGDADAAFASAPVKVDQVYRTPYEHHNPMEAHSLVASWDGDHLTIYDSSQNIFAVRSTMAQLFQVPVENVHVESKFVGGAFGSKGSSWPHVPIAALAARVVRRPVKLVVTRKQLFFGNGHRPETAQRVALGANPDGKLVAFIHEGYGQSNDVCDYAERFVRPTRAIYASPNIRGVNPIVSLNIPSPTYMRAPGENPGMFAIESAMDELAVALKMDPVQLRLVNYADDDPVEGKPWSSKSLRQCYRQAAERFGWSKRNPEPRSMRDGRLLVGWGMASSTYPAHRAPASARAVMSPDGSVVVSCGSHEMGMGTATVMAQLAAETLGIPFERVRFEYGDTKLPQAPISAGSMTAASVGSAVFGVANALKNKIVALASGDAASPLHGATADQVVASDGRIALANDSTRSERYSEVLARHYLHEVDAEFHAQPEQNESHTSQAFGAVFAEVTVDPELGMTRARRIVAAFAGGRVLNAKTAESQFYGGIIQGIGMALLEHTQLDRRIGSFVNVNFGEYLVPVNTDIHSIEVIQVPEEDPYVNPIGAKGLGEIGIVGVAPAIANAVYHATGKRIRELPITLDKLL